MICKSVTLKVFCSKTPCQLTILDCNGVVIKTCTVNNFCSQICVCTTGHTLRLIAQYQSQTLCQIIHLCCCRRQSIYVSLIFHMTNVFLTLRDRNYGFPIANATLGFTTA